MTKHDTSRPKHQSKLFHWHLNYFVYKANQVVHGSLPSYQTRAQPTAQQTLATVCRSMSAVATATARMRRPATRCVRLRSSPSSLRHGSRWMRSNATPFTAKQSEQRPEVAMSAACGSRSRAIRCEIRTNAFQARHTKVERRFRLAFGSGKAPPGRAAASVSAMPCAYRDGGGSPWPSPIGYAVNDFSLKRFGCYESNSVGKLVCFAR